MGTAVATQPIGEQDMRRRRDVALRIRAAIMMVLAVGVVVVIWAQIFESRTGTVLGVVIAFPATLAAVVVSIIRSRFKDD